MRIFLIIVIYITLFETFNGQNITISDPINVRNDNFFDIIPHISDNYVILKQKSDKIVVNTFDSNLQYLGEKQLEIEVKKLEIVSISYCEQNWTIIYSFINHGDKHIRAKKYDFKCNVIDSLDILTEKSSFLDKEFKVVNSEDKSKTLLFRPNNDDEIESIIVDVLNFKILFSDKIKIVDLNVNFDFREVEISDYGNIYFLFQKSSGLFKKLKNNIIIYKYDRDLSIADHKLLSLEFEFDNFKLKFDNINKNIVIAGIVNKAYSNKSNAYFIIKYDEELDLVLLKKNNYNPQLLKNYYQSSSFKPKDYFNFLIVQDMLLRNDGGIILVLEEKEVYTRNNNIYGRNRMSNPTEYQDLLYGNIILISTHESGEEFWSQSITKDQNSINDGGIYSSFGLFRTSHRLGLIFNDDISNTTQVTLYTFDPLGNMNRTAVFNTDKLNIKLILKDIVQLTSYELVAVSYNNDELKLVKLDIQ